MASVVVTHTFGCFTGYVSTFTRYDRGNDDKFAVCFVSTIWVIGIAFTAHSIPTPVEYYQLRSLLPISSSMLNIVRPQVLPDFVILIFGRLLNTTQPSQRVTDCSEDGYNDILALHMLALEEEWYEDGADEVLNRHMEAYESREGKLRKN